MRSELMGIEQGTVSHMMGRTANDPSGATWHHFVVSDLNQRPEPANARAFLQQSTVL